jgi:uncharacterized protein YcbK (DUF882 family)
MTGILEMKLASTVMAGWMSAAAPMPLPHAAMLVLEHKVTMPVEVSIYDENRHVSGKFLIARDGSMDPATKRRLTWFFRCRDTNMAYPIRQKTIAMMVAIAERYDDKPIELVSAYRMRKIERRTSPHRHARALDFRVRGVNLRELRDFLWRSYTEVGIGWYPEEQFIHMDSRPTMHDTAWTKLNGKNRYKPHWSKVAREPAPDVRVATRGHGI